MTPAPETPAPPAVSLRDAAVELDGRPVWADVNLDIAPHEMVAVLGPNGAGKSTLLRVILGLQPLSAGTLCVLGREPERGDPRIGYLPQHRTADADVRIRGRDLVRLGLDGARWGVPLPRWCGPRRHDAITRAVGDVIALCGAAEYADRSIDELSGGERQRLLVAQAIVSQPNLLLLDEPLESLDMGSQQEVSALVRSISRDRGVTVLLVAHDVNPILPYIDRVLYVAGGHTAIGDPDEVINSETLTRLYDAPIEVITAASGRRIVVGQPDAVSFHGHA